MNPVKLAFEVVPAKSKTKNTPWIFLHGMMGSKRNYHSLAKHKSISGENDAYLLDLRNHGESPHVDSMSVTEMAKDIIRFMDDNNLQQANILGHSLGGRVLMETSISYPERVKNQIIVDIGPFDYVDKRQFPHTESTRIILEELNALDLTNTSRNELRENLGSITGGQKMLADFFMMGLQESENEKGNFRWQMNLPVICKSYESILGYTPEPRISEWKGKMKAFVGRKSSYVVHNRLHEFENYFSTFSHEKDVVWFEAGHWIHYEKPNEFLQEFRHFNETLNH